MRKADNPLPYCAVVKKSRSLNFLDPPGPAWPVTGVFYLCFTKSLIRNNHLDVLRRICTKTEIPEDGINGRLSASESKLVCDLTYTV